MFIDLFGRLLANKTSFTARQIKKQHKHFLQHFPLGSVTKDDIIESLSEILPQQFSEIFRKVAICSIPGLIWKFNTTFITVT